MNMAGRPPSAVVEGLAVYSLGSGPPLLLMPNPQGMVAASSSAGGLARLLVNIGFRVSTFDPPGAFASAARNPRLDLGEMIEGAEMTLVAADIDSPVPVVGHSQGALAALAYALERPASVCALALVGAVEGGLAATRRAGGLPFEWSWLDPDFWRFAWLGTKLSLGRGKLADYKRLRRLFVRRSYADPALAPQIEIEPDDWHLPPPARAGWQRAVRDVDLRPRLPEITAPTLVCVGRHDPQTPLRGNLAIAEALGDARLEIFERSGHYPYEEEPARFSQVVRSFLAERFDLARAERRNAV